MRVPIAGLIVTALGAVLVFASVDNPAVPGQISLGMLARLYPPVQLDHAVHVEVAGDCTSCHHQPFGQPGPCARCHEDSVQPSAFVHELHWEVEDCTGCHHRPATTDLRCVSCHNVEPDPERLEMIGLKGAYHGLCLRCHLENGSDASCGRCHPDR